MPRLTNIVVFAFVSRAEVVEAGNQMLRIEQMAETMMSGSGDGFLDRLLCGHEGAMYSWHILNSALQVDSYYKMIIHFFNGDTR